MIVMIVELFLGRKGYFTGRYEEDKELEIEFRENPGEDILRFIEQTLREESCKSDNIQLAGLFKSRNEIKRVSIQ